MKVREGGRVVNVAVLVATGVNGGGHREILGLQVATTEDRAGWLTFFRALTARGLTGMKLVTSKCPRRPVCCDRGTLPGAAWQRCRTHYAASSMRTVPKSSWPWVKTLLHAVYDQPDTGSVHAQFDRVLDALEHNCRKWSPTSMLPARPRGPHQIPGRRHQRTRGGDPELHAFSA